MKKSINLIFVILLPIIHGDSNSSEGDVPISLYTKMYCQTEFVIKEQLISVDDTENGYKLLAEDTDKVNCATVLSQSSNEIYEQLTKELKKKKYPKKSIACHIKNLKKSNYHEIRFKINSLLGLNLPNQQKAEFRDNFNSEIASAIEKSVDECESGNSLTTQGSSSSSEEN